MKVRILVSLLLLAASAVRAQSYGELVEKAMDCALNDSLPQAERLFREALKLEPNNARNALLFSNLGTVQKRMGKTDEAIRSYTLALNITPYSTAMLLNRAALYMEKNLLDKAYLDYCNVIDLIPGDKEARLFRAYIYMQQRQYGEARIDYNVLLAADGQNKPARLGVAMLDQKEGKYAAARTGLDLLITDYPDDVSLYKMRANLELEQNRPDMALLDLEEAEKRDGQDAGIFLMKGDIYLEMKKKTEARAAYGRAMELGVSRLELQDKLKECR